MLGTAEQDPNVGWPRAGEIDLAVLLPKQQVQQDFDQLATNAIVDKMGWWNARAAEAIKWTPVADASFYDSWHTAMLTWTPLSLVFEIDGDVKFHVERKATYGEWPFDEPFFHLLNIEMPIGGSSPCFPELEVDYVSLANLPAPSLVKSGRECDSMAVLSYWVPKPAGCP